MSVIIDGKEIATPAGLSVTNFRSPGVHRFAKARRRRRPVGQIIIHETTGSSVDPAHAFKSLRSRDLSVHLIAAPDGRITQHGDLLRDVLDHAWRNHNPVSVGIEVMNPYYPARRKAGPWNQIIPAGWADMKRYVVPTPQQAEATSQLIKWITSPAAEGLSIPRVWIGVRDGHMAMNRVPRDRRASPGVRAHTSPGIWAHTYFGHADGAWLVLYAWLRLEACYSPRDAYEEAIRLSLTAKRIKGHGWWVKLPTLTFCQRPSDYSCVAPRLHEFEFESFEVAEPSCRLVPIAAKPTPGRFYTIKRGVDSKGLIDLAGRAYGVSDFGAKKRLSQRINNHRYNHRFWRKNLASDLYPQGRISFNPRFSSAIAQQRDAVSGAAPFGHAFATIYIPLAP